MRIHRWTHVGLILLVIAAIGTAGWFALGYGKPVFGREAARSEEAKPNPAVTVEVVQPTPGGIRRICVQPGSVEPFKAADLYAKASGFLASQLQEREGKFVEVNGQPVEVDIGTRVKAGDVLARIAVPEYEKQVQRDVAKVKNAEAKVRQMLAHLEAAKSESKAAAAGVTLAEVMVRAKTAYRKYREKQLNRMKELARERAIEARVVEEQEDYNQSALEAESAALEGVNTAKEKAAAAVAKIDQAQADVDEARAGVEVAKAELEKSQELVKYTIIKSPYDGVVTKRNFHPGDFIKSAEQGGNVPLLAVERTDVMRIVVQVPDRDVPFVSLGDPAVIEIDALPGVTFQTTDTDKVGVSRWADAEDPATRTMRTEIDVRNLDDKLRHGMYGQVTIVLSEGTPAALRVPSGALIGKAEGGRGSVRVVTEKNTVHVVPVRYVTDNGVETEIVAGLSPTDKVIVRATGPIEEGTAVTIGGDAKSAGH